MEQTTKSYGMRYMLIWTAIMIWEKWRRSIWMQMEGHGSGVGRRGSWESPVYWMNSICKSIWWKWQGTWKTVQRMPGRHSVMWSKAEPRKISERWLIGWKTVQNRRSRKTNWWERRLYPLELDSGKNPFSKPKDGKGMQCGRACKPCSVSPDEFGMLRWERQNYKKVGKYIESMNHSVSTEVKKYAWFHAQIWGL